MAKQKKSLKTTFLHIFKDKNGNVVIVQKPNIPLIVWFILAMLGYFISDGMVGLALDYIVAAALMLWALLEVFYGINIFRRILGIVVLVALFYF
ncbi:hypothetical protein KC950_02140 [Candidatus Saccharibacteria bacterium]|nr:hypothetical protein [Candidatus Saccharibacteria bacterium]